MNKKDYAQHLNHPLWQKKRDEVFNHYGRRCIKCQKTKSLAVHHKTYSNGKMPWEYPIENFTVLCEKCHSAMHSIQYTQNTCKICGIEISKNYIYCFDCNKNQVKRLSERSKDFERKIIDLNKKLALEKRQTKSIDSVKINKLISQRDRLISERDEQVKQLSKQNRDFERKIIELNKKLDYERNKKESIDHVRVRKLKFERDQLISERSEVEKLLSEIDRGRKEDSLQVQSQIKSIKTLLIAISIIVVVGVAVVVVIFFQKSLSNQELHAKDLTTNKSGESKVAPVPSGKTVTSKKATFSELKERKIIASNVNVSPITTNDIGKYVSVTSMVISIYNHPKGHKFLTVLILDKNQEIDVPIFSRLKFTDSRLKVNSIIKISGKVNTYKDKLQIVPKSSKDITIIREGQNSDIKYWNVSEINESHRGQIVKVKGHVDNYRDHKGTVYCNIVDDSNNRIKAVLFKPEIKELSARKNLLKSAEENKFPVTVIATVNVYKGDVQLILDKVYK
jgi:hypothetical protein